jgi:putative ABC transport system ATP-binding protein
VGERDVPSSPQLGRNDVVEATNLYRFFHAGGEETQALTGVSLVARAGEVVAVTGPSGSGKSTLVGCLAGLDEPDGGMVRIAGEQMTRRTEAERALLRSRQVGMLFQTGNLIEHLTVIQNIDLTQMLAGRVDRKLANRLLASVGLGAYADRVPAHLSGGELVRAGLAVALANEPAVIIADEPTGELDEATADHVMSLLRRHARAGACVVLVTHDPQVADAADREIRLRDGAVVA